MHLRCHGRESEYALDPQLSAVLNEVATEGILSDGWLRFANEDDDISLSFRIRPGEPPIAGQRAGPDQPAFDFDILYFEKTLW